MFQSIDSNGRTIWIADAHRGDGKRFIVRADEKLTAFLELEIATGGQRDGFLGKGVFLAWGNSARLIIGRATSANNAELRRTCSVMLCQSVMQLSIRLDLRGNRP